MTEIIRAFLVGGAICAVGQLFIDFTKLTPARILTGYVVAGVVLSALGLYRPLADFAGAGASVPLTGFGHALAEGMRKAVDLPPPSCSGRGIRCRSEQCLPADMLEFIGRTECAPTIPFFSRADVGISPYKV